MRLALIFSEVSQLKTVTSAISSMVALLSTIFVKTFLFNEARMMMITETLKFRQLCLSIWPLKIGNYVKLHHQKSNM
jgi:hypothetical protein